MLRAGRGRHHDALAEFTAAEHLGSQVADSHALAAQVIGWLLATQARAGLPGQARATLAPLDDTCSLGSPTDSSVTSARPTRPPNAPSPSPSRAAWSCRSP